MEDTARVIALIDMDCFYVQVEERDNPEIKGVPAAVVQYRTYKGGGIIAINYEARAKGVTRGMMGDDAKQQCAEIKLVRVPETNGKANLTKYRDAGKEVVDVFLTFPNLIVERASIDEVYIDLSDAVNKLCESRNVDPAFDSISCLDSLDVQYLECSFPIGQSSMESWFTFLKRSDFVSVNDIRLAVGAEIVGKMRRAVLEKTGFKCSAGIAHNKVLAKLGAGFNKPNKQTVIPQSTVQELYAQTKIRKVRMLGGQTGDALVGHFNVEKMSELVQFSLRQLCNVLGEERGKWIYDLVRGIDHEPVSKRELAQSIGCSKNFRGPEMLKGVKMCAEWIEKLAMEVVERLQKDYELNNRKARSFTLHLKFFKEKPISRVIGHNLPYDVDRVTTAAVNVLEKLKTNGNFSVDHLGLIASRLEEEDKQVHKITEFYKKPVAPPATSVKAQLTSDEAQEAKANGLNEETVPPAAAHNNIDRREQPAGPFDNSVIAAQREMIARAVNPTKILSTDSDSEMEVDIESCTPTGQPPQVVKRRKTTESDASCEPLNHAPVETEEPMDFIPPVILSDSSTSAHAKAPTSRALFPSSENPRATRTLSTSVKESKTVTTSNQPRVFSSTSPVKNLAVDCPTAGNIQRLFPNLDAEEDSLAPEQKQQAAPAATKSASATTSGASEHDGPSTSAAVRAELAAASSSSTTTASKKPAATTTRQPKEYHEICPKCDKDIPIWELFAHQDFHVAADLQCVYDAAVGQNLPIPKSSPTKPVKKSEVTATKGAKRGRGGKSSTPEKSNGRIKTIDTYFNRRQ